MLFPQHIFFVDLSSPSYMTLTVAVFGFLQTYRWWSLCTFYLLTCHMRVTIGDSGLCCCVLCLLSAIIVLIPFPVSAECQVLARRSAFHPSTGKRNLPRGRPCVWIAALQSTLRSMIALDENSQLYLWLMKRQLKSFKRNYKNSRLLDGFRFLRYGLQKETLG